MLESYAIMYQTRPSFSINKVKIKRARKARGEMTFVYQQYNILYNTYNKVWCGMSERWNGDGILGRTEKRDEKTRHRENSFSFLLFFLPFLVRFFFPPFPNPGTKTTQPVGPVDTARTCNVMQYETKFQIIPRPKCLYRPKFSVRFVIFFFPPAFRCRTCLFVSYPYVSPLFSFYLLRYVHIHTILKGSNKDLQK